MSQPLGPDAFEDPPLHQPPNATESLGPNVEVKEPPIVPPKPRPGILKPRFGKPILPENKRHDSPSTTVDVLPSVRDLKPLVPENKDREAAKQTIAREVAVDVEVKETPDFLLSKHESFRSRINPLLQRSSRLRSSLIFASSKAEMHSSGLDLKPATEEDEKLDTVRTSSIVTQILEKRRSLSREPFEWRKKFEEKSKEKLKEKDEKEAKEQEEIGIKLKDEFKTEKEPQKTNREVKLTSGVEKSEDTTPSFLSIHDPASRLQYFKDLAAKRKASKMETESSLKAPEPAEKKPDLSDKPFLNPGMTSNIPSVSVTSADSEPKKPDISAKLTEFTQKPFTSKPPINTSKHSVSHLKLPETSQHPKEENVSEGQKKEIFKSLKPLPSPKIFRKDPLKFIGLNPRRISCGEEILTKDATDAEKSELKKNRSHSSSTLPREDAKEGLHKVMGSTTSINTLGEGKGESKPFDILKKKTQKLKEFLGPKDKDKKSSGDDKAMNTVTKITEDSSKNQSSSDKDTGSTNSDQITTSNKTSTGTSGPTRYQAQGSSVLFNSNLRDDTKVILEQISANSQKNRTDREETMGDRDSDRVEKAMERQNSMKWNRFLRPQSNNQEREGLLKRIESLRKEKKVYSRFEVVCHSKDHVYSIDGKEI